MNVRQTLFCGALWVASVGWLLPLALSSLCLWRWLRTEVSPTVYGGQPMSNSFPLLRNAEGLFWVAFAWLSIVVMAWSAWLLSVASKRR